MATNEDFWEQLSREEMFRKEQAEEERRSRTAAGRCPNCGSKNVCVEYPPDNNIIADTQSGVSYGQSRMKCNNCKKLFL